MSAKSALDNSPNQEKGAEQRRVSTPECRGKVPPIEEMHPLLHEIIEKQATINIGNYQLVGSDRFK